MVIHLANTRRCRACGRRMLLWRWRWAHRRCTTTQMASGYEPPSMSLLLPHASGAKPGTIGAHPWQEFNEHGNSCHYPGCHLTEEEHATFQRPALRPGEGQYDCFLADRCVDDPRCQLTSAACRRAS